MAVTGGQFGSVNMASVPPLTDEEILAVRKLLNPMIPESWTKATADIPADLRITMNTLPRAKPRIYDARLNEPEPGWSPFRAAPSGEPFPMWPCRVVDANGNKSANLLVQRCNMDTGYVEGPHLIDGKIDCVSGHVARWCEYWPAPLRLEPCDDGKVYDFVDVRSVPRPTTGQLRYHEPPKSLVDAFAADSDADEPVVKEAKP